MSDSLRQTPWTAACQASLSFTILSLLKFVYIELVMPSNHLILCHPLLFLPSIFPSIRVFSNELALLIRWPKYWNFSFSISPSIEYSGLISFRIDWFDLLAVQGILKSLLQHHSSEASVLWCSAFFMVQLSHLCVATGKTIPLTIWTFVGKVMSLLFNYSYTLKRKKNKPVDSKGSQPWTFIGRTIAGAEAPILWPPDAKNWLIGKDPDAGEDWRQEEKGMTKDEMVREHHWLTGHEFEQTLGDNEGQRSLVSKRARHNLVAEWQQQIESVYKWENYNCYPLGMVYSITF